MPSALNWLGYVVGLVAGLQQLIIWMRSRRLSKAQSRAFEILNSQLNAEEAKEAASKYESMRESLRLQVEQDIPREARRVYLKNRLDRLGESLSHDYEEYSAIEQELGLASEASQLDIKIRDVVQESLLPELRTRRRRERVLVGLVGLLVLLNFLPLGQLPVVLLVALAEPNQHGYDEFILSLLFLAGLAATATIFWLSTFRPSWHIPLPTKERLIFAWGIFAFTVLSAGVGVAIRWNWIHSKSDKYFFNPRNDSYNYGSYSTFWLSVGYSCVIGIFFGILVFSERARRSRLHGKLEKRE